MVVKFDQLFVIDSEKRFETIWMQIVLRRKVLLREQSV
jgi:hypothetical protein